MPQYINLFQLKEYRSRVCKIQHETLCGNCFRIVNVKEEQTIFCFSPTKRRYLHIILSNHTVLFLVIYATNVPHKRYFFYEGNSVMHEIGVKSKGRRISKYFGHQLVGRTNRNFSQFRSIRDN